LKTWPVHTLFTSQRKREKRERERGRERKREGERERVVERAGVLSVPNSVSQSACVIIILITDHIL